MTYQPAQLQDLIRAIDEVLGKSSPRLPWVMSGEADQQRRVLEETRRYLSRMEQQGGGNAGSALAHDPMNQGYAVPIAPTSPAESAQQVLQAMLQEMSYLRTTVMQPLRNDLEVLYRQRDRLLQEIHELESQRQQSLLTDAAPPAAATLPAADQQRLISEFLQTLMGRLQSDLTGQVAQMLTEIETQTLRDSQSDPYGNRPAASQDSLESPPSYSSTETPLAAAAPTLTPAERLQQIQRIQSQSDQLLLKLDSSLRVIFESLQSNIETYQESLSLGLDKMNTLGQQGESIFAAMVNRLAEQLSREASHYLQASIQDAEWQPATGSLPQSQAAATNHPAEQWPPAALVTPPSTAAEQTPAPIDPIDQLLSELEEDLEADLTVLQAPTAAFDQDFDEELTVFQVPEPSSAEPIAVDTRPMSAAGASSLLDELDDLEALDLLTQELENLELAAVPELPELEELEDLEGLEGESEDLTMFQIDESVVTHIQDEEPEAEALTIFQIDEAATDEEPIALTGTGLSIEDLDSALDLLGQISTQLDAELEQTESAPAELDADLEAEMAAALDAADPDANAAYDDLDAFYESLFGVDADAPPSEVADAEGIVDRHLSDAEQRAIAANLAWEQPIVPFDALGIPAAETVETVEIAETVETVETDETVETVETGLGSLDDLEGDLFGGQADPATDPVGNCSTVPSEAATPSASPTVDELVELLGEFINPAAAAPVEPEEQTQLQSSPPLAPFEQPSERSPETVEHLLFGESPEPPPADLEEADFSLNAPQAKTSKPEVIRSLNDLLQFMATDSVLEPAPGTPTSGLAADADDRYEPANPSEDLLGTEDDLSSSRPEVQVNHQTLEQLAADLSGLEGLAADRFTDDLFSLGSPSTAANVSTNAAPSADWSLPDLPPEAGQSYWQEGADSEDDLFIANLFPVAEESDEVTLLLDGPPPGLSGPSMSPPPQQAIAPPTTPESLAEWVNALDESDLLPPDREDLSLSDFQAVMSTEPTVAEPAPPAIAAGSDDLPSNDLFANAELFPDSPAIAPAADPDSLSDFLADFSVEVPPAPAPVRDPALDPNPQDLASPPRLDATNLSDLFADLPPALPRHQPGAGSTAENLENLSLSVPAPPPGNTAFTLSGLESLFEDVPSVGEITPVPPPDSSGAAPGAASSSEMTAADLSSLFGDAETTPEAANAPTAQNAPADAPAPSNEAKKKFPKPLDREPRGFGRLQPHTRRPD